MKPKLPEEKIGMEAVMFNDLGDGGYIQLYRNEQYGVSCTIERLSRKVPVTRTFYHDDYPDREFKTMDEIKEAQKGT